MPGILKVGFLELPSKSLIFCNCVLFSDWYFASFHWKDDRSTQWKEVRSANYFIKLLPCGPLLRTWESTFRKLTSISNNCFFYILLFQTPQKNTCYRFKVDGQTSVNDSFSCCKIDWRMVLSKLRQFSASSSVREKLTLLQLEGFVLRFIFKYYLDNAKL